MQFSAKREEFVSSLRKKDNEELFMKRRLKAMQKVDDEKRDQLDFTMEDVINGTALEAIVKSKAEKLKNAIQNDDFPTLLQNLKFFRKRLSLAREEKVICAQFRQLDLIQDIVHILRKYKFINDHTRAVFEEASWAMANFCSGSAESIEFLIHHDFFDIAIEIFEKTTELELFQNVCFT